MIRNLAIYYRYCCEDLTKIEGFQEAVNDRSNTKWVLHHRMETNFPDGERRTIQLSASQLEELGMYYHRPASEFIFLTKDEHNRVHTCGRKLSKETVEAITSKTCKQVRCIELDKIFPSLKAAAKFLGRKSCGGIVGACKGEYQTSGGYHWEYVEGIDTIRQEIENLHFVKTYYKRSDGVSKTSFEWEMEGFLQGGICKSIQRNKPYKGFNWERETL